MLTTAGFAKAILGLNFGTMMEICEEFSSMVDDDVRTAPKTAHDFASLLHDWADANSPSETE